jgi:hypothetical protein
VHEGKAQGLAGRCLNFRQLDPHPTSAASDVLQILLEARFIFDDHGAAMEVGEKFA